ncbi:MAG TPA: MerR family transcriptional regulator [Candidatus Dormibacteraeota bacterium]|nr:MerR family transcriptional regulator [Candidatus Dormibacteraeota bacterium]
MRIAELAARHGLQSSAIRYYEKEGLLGTPLRKNGRRVYSAESAYPLVLICFAKQTGFTLGEIKLLLHGFPATTPAGVRWRRLARKKIKELTAMIARAQAMEKMLGSLMRCRCRTLEQCARGLSKHMREPGGGNRSRLKFSLEGTCR